MSTRMFSLCKQVLPIVEVPIETKLIDNEGPTTYSMADLQGHDLSFLSLPLSSFIVDYLVYAFFPFRDDGRTH